MPQPQNRFQIKLDSTQYTDPQDWINFTPKTERHKIYRTLLSTFSEGRIRLIKTAKNYVDTSYDLYGPTATIDVEWLEYDYATDAYVAIFALGRLNLSEKYKRTRDYTEVGFEPTSFIMNILNRDEIVANLQDKVDMDGSAITAFTDETHTITVSDQYIDFAASFEHVGQPGINYTSGASVSTLYCQLPLFTKEIVNEDIIEILDTNLPFDVPTYLTTTPAENQIVFLEDGDVEMTFDWLTAGDIRTQMAQTGGWTLDASAVLGIYYKINDGTEQLITSATYLSTSPDSNPVIKDLTIATLSLSGISKGDAFKIYVKVTPFTGSNPPQILVSSIALTKITQTTTFDDTDCEFMFPWEILLRLCQKITGRNDCLRSTFFGRTDGEVKTYVSDGDGALFSITSPKLMRGFPLATNPINADLMTVFKGFDSLFLLGLGVVYESGVPYISIERLEDFMDGTSSATTFVAAYPGIDWTAATNYIWGNVKAGYSKYKLDRNPTISSPHSERVYTLPFLSDLISKEYKNVCPFIASGHLIELIRRDRYEDSTKKDGKYDDDLIVLHLKRNGGTFERELDGDFSTVTNIDNPTTNSNLHITPARNMLRQAPLLLAGLAKKIINAAYTGYIRYEAGTGNTEAETTVTGDTLVDEQENLSRAQAAEVYSSTPLFDASEMGSCEVTITKAQRILMKEGLLTEITVTDDGSTYTGFIESIKEVNLEKGTAVLMFLSNTGI